MISSKNFNKVTIIIVSVAVVLSLLAMLFSDILSEFFDGTDYSLTYASELFDTNEILSIDIVMDQDDWDDMLENAMSEEYYQCEVVINGTQFSRVGIRPKGNTSLSSIVSDPDNDRYSFKLEFDQFVDGQNCWGLDKLVLNNMYADNTYMKEAIIYDMFQYLGADASLYNFAKITVNGEYWGVYLALEAVEESFMVRNYGSENGHIYKPDGMNMGGGDNDNRRAPGADNAVPDEMHSQMREKMQEFMQTQGNETTEGENAPADGTFSPPDMSQMIEMREMSGGGGRGMMGSNGGGNLNYTDDNTDSYSTIWDGAVIDGTEADHQAVVTALKNISEGTNLETYMDVDNVLKYMAVHNFAVNEDSLSGSMAHNYYLYENNGRLNILPWDYNLSFGGMHGGGSSSSVINDPIDEPYQSTNFFDALLENEEYCARYHEYYQQLVDEYIFGGEFDEFYESTRSQIDGLVETDPTAMCTYEEYLAGADMVYDVVKLRGESVKGQLGGTIPSTSEGQQADSSTLIDATDIDISALGSMNMGGGGRGGFGQRFEEAEVTGNSQYTTEIQEKTDTKQRDFRSFSQNQQEEVNVDYKMIVASVCILLAAMILLKFIKRRN